MPKTEEKDLQTKANEYAECSLSSIRDMVQALEHADECDGTTECDECAGSGKNPDFIEDQDDTLCTCDSRSWAGPEHDTACELEGPREQDCKKCEGTGETKCTEGADSDDPESWHDSEAARRRIEEDALSVEVRSDWHTPGDEDASQPSEYNILITTGGPAARIIGELDGYQQPKTARFEYQDWFTPWTEANTQSSDDAVMLKYAQQFYFGE